MVCIAGDSFPAGEPATIVLRHQVTNTYEAGPFPIARNPYKGVRRPLASSAGLSSISAQEYSEKTLNDIPHTFRPSIKERGGNGYSGLMRREKERNKNCLKKSQCLIPVF